MRYAIMAALACVAACQGRPLSRETHGADSLDFPALVPRGVVDSALVRPRVVGQPSVVLFWLRAADTLDAGDQSDAFDEIGRAHV